MSDKEIDLECPRCHQRLRVPASKAGTMIWCHDCDAGIEVPGETRMQGAPSWPRNDSPWSGENDELPEPRIRRTRTAAASGAVLPPAICMMVVAAIGLLCNISGLVIAASDPEFGVDAQAPPVLQQWVRNSKGWFQATVQGSCAFLSAFTILGSVQMMRRKTWGLGLAASIVSMINFGNCCCLFGLPVGIWALVAITNAEVRDSFS